MTPDNPSSRELTVGFSPCPNDTFIFHALVQGLVPSPGLRWRTAIEDVETLNRWAFERRLPVTKISFHAHGALREDYVLLRSGAALGQGCGPLLVARNPTVLRRLSTARIAIPGQWTSAALLLRMYAPQLKPQNLIEVPFHHILDLTERGEVDAGLIIHESRFTYANHGLVSLVDLGEWWEEESGHLIPLGGIIALRSLGVETLHVVESALRESVRHARRHPDASAEFVREHAQELADDVVRAHIDLYVNDFTEDLGQQGLAAIRAMFTAAEERGILTPFTGSITLGK